MKRAAQPRQIGRFKVHQRFFDRLAPGEGTNLFDGMVVIDIKRDYLTGDAEYIAVHPQFREIAHGEIVPEYIGYFTHEQGSTSLPNWVEVKQQEFTYEEVSAALSARLHGDAGVRDRSASFDARFNAFVGERSQHLDREGEQRRLVDIQRLGWLDRLLQRWWPSLFARLHPGLRNAIAGRHVPEGRQRELLDPVGPGDARQEHDAHRDGMLGQGAGSDESAADALGADVAPWPYLPARSSEEARLGAPGYGQAEQRRQDRWLDPI